MQFQADILGRPVVAPPIAETSALGAAYAAGLAVGFWSGLDELREMDRAARRWEPAMDEATRAAGHRPLAQGHRADARLGGPGRLGQGPPGSATTPDGDLRIGSSHRPDRRRISLEPSVATTGSAIDRPSGDQIRWLSAYWSK